MRRQQEAAVAEHIAYWNCKPWIQGLECQHMTHHHVTINRRRADILVCYPLIKLCNFTLEATTTCFIFAGQTRLRNALFQCYCDGIQC